MADESTWLIVDRRWTEDMLIFGWEKEEEGRPRTRVELNKNWYTIKIPIQQSARNVVFH